MPLLIFTEKKVGVNTIYT